LGLGVVVSGGSGTQEIELTFNESKQGNQDGQQAYYHMVHSNAVTFTFEYEFLKPHTLP
jgi:hypothetical protein